MVEKQGKPQTPQPVSPRKSVKQVREAAQRIVVRREKALRELGDR